MKLYKLTDQRCRTLNDTKWGEGVTLTIPDDCRGTGLCGPGVLHAYKNSNLGLLLNPIHARFSQPIIWEAEGDVVVEDWGKVGGHKLTTVKKLPLPRWYTDENARNRVCVRFAILCAERVIKYYEDKYQDDDRPRKAIEAAKEYLADKASHADAADAAAAAYAAAAADDAAAYAAAYAAYAAAAAARAVIDFGGLADLAVSMIIGDVNDE